MPKKMYGGYKPGKGWGGTKAGGQSGKGGLGDGSKVGFQDQGSGAFGSGEKSKAAVGGGTSACTTKNDVKR